MADRSESGVTESSQSESGVTESSQSDRTVSVSLQQVDKTTVAHNEGTQNGQVAAATPPPAAPRAGGWQMLKTLAIRMVVIYFISSWLRRPTPPKSAPDGSGRPLMAMMPSTNIFFKETSMDMFVYISETKNFKDFNNPAALFWKQEHLVYGDWTSGLNGDGNYEKKGQIPVSQRLMNNKSSIYMHVYIVQSGNSPDPSDKEHYVRSYTIKKTKQLNKFKKRRFHNTINLLTGTTDAHPDLIRANGTWAKDDNKTVEILSHWHPNMTINLIDDHTPWVNGSVPAPLDDYIEYVPDEPHHYYPIVFFNEYWNLNSEYMPINDTTPMLNLSITYQPISLFKWQMYAAQGMRQRWYSFLGEDFMEESDQDQDSLKITFLETNPYLLGLTIFVSIIHSVFEFLAFKNDIQFWRNRKSMEGLSVRSVFFNVFQSLIVLLYVLDNETNFVVRVSVFAGLAIEIWKIFKVIDVKVDRENLWFGAIPRISLQEKSTYIESSTKKYDMMAFKYLSWGLFPLLACYAVYSVIYVEHKGWYSWVLSLLYGFLLTFGFIMMTPQLFINYKLKSVAHLPWRMLTYKALNTFIDDLFAFVIKMPTLYRLGCFRDDIVFIIYVYQRYKYRVDPKRVNEFGTTGEMHDDAKPPSVGPAGQAAIEDTPDRRHTPDGEPVEDGKHAASMQGDKDAVIETSPKNQTSTKNKTSPKNKKGKNKDKPKDKMAKKTD